MTIKSSGPLSLSEINDEFARGRNLNAYRGTSYYNTNGTAGTFSSSSISISHFYNKAAARPTFSFRYIIVAGGGGGGSGVQDNVGGGGAGGGGGQVYTGYGNFYLASSASITIGSGGTRGYYGPNGTYDEYGNPINGYNAAQRGGETQFTWNDSGSFIRAYGGYPGATGSGAGGAGGDTYNSGGGYHSAGGSDGTHAGGGGGGVDDANNTNGYGGNGPLLFDGNYWAGGGGGGGDYSTGAAGGLGQGGHGGIWPGITVNGADGYDGGGGGGGGSYGGGSMSPGGNGGSGVMVIRYDGGTPRLSFSAGTNVSTFIDSGYVTHYIRNNTSFTVS